jgi:hypothetical protein
MDILINQHKTWNNNHGSFLPQTDLSSLHHFAKGGRIQPGPCKADWQWRTPMSKRENHLHITASHPLISSMNLPSDLCIVSIAMRVDLSCFSPRLPSLWRIATLMPHGIQYESPEKSWSHFSNILETTEAILLVTSLTCWELPITLWGWFQYPSSIWINDDHH